MEHTTPAPIAESVRRQILMDYWRKLDSHETEATLHLLRTDDPATLKALIAGIRKSKRSLAALLNDGFEEA